VKLNPSPRLGQAVSGSLLLGIAVTAGATGLYLNVNHGLQVSVAAGILFGLADLTRITLPIVCGLVGWTLQMRLVAVVCVATSLYCVLMAFNGAADKNLVVQQHAATQYALAKSDVAKLETRVAFLDDQVAKEAKNKGCGNVCKAFKEQATSARAELVTARNHLTTATPVAVSGNELLQSRITSILFLVLIESLVWMSVPAMQLISQAMSAPVSTTVAPSVVTEKPKKTPKPVTKKKTTSKKRWSKIEAYMEPNAPVFAKPDRRRKSMKPKNDNQKTLMPAND
jgi:hypothetical protein